MPNWVRNRIEIEGKNINKIFARLSSKDEEGHKISVDFNKITPMPNELYIISGSITESCKKLFLHSIQGNEDFDKYLAVTVKNDEKYISMSDDEYKKLLEDSLKYTEFPSNEPKFQTEKEILDYGKLALDNILNYGAQDWYKWSIANWGTKWNASESKCRNNVISFETAWDPVVELFAKFSKEFPDNIFNYSFSDEQVCQYCGEFKIQNGEVIGRVYESESNEAFEKGFELWPGTSKYFKFNKKKNCYERADSNME